MIFSIIILLIIFTSKCSISTSSNSSHLMNSAFCEPWSSYKDRYFPVDLRERHIPWIWDAVYDPVQSWVELTTINRTPCRFVKRRWIELFRKYSNHSHELAYGLTSNIIVPVDPETTLNEEFFLLGHQVLCEYFDEDKSVHQVLSHRIKGAIPFASLGTLQIRCPVPPSGITWKFVRFHLPENRTEYTTDIYSNVTATVSACSLPRYDPMNKIYNLTVCTATGRADREHLVEWIEYHRLVGVDHFYIYDTALDDKDRLSKTLRDYINESIVTVIPWHFMNCVRYMANGRWNAELINGSIVFFESPKAIAQYTALASCYVRFKYTSRYMSHIDEDEFLSFSGMKVGNELKLSSSPHNLVAVSDALFHAHPEQVAIRFEPILFLPCNSTPGREQVLYNAIEYPPDIRFNLLLNSANSMIPTPLPRVGVWDVSRVSPRKHECKLIMRTDAVGMYLVHFVSMTEHGTWTGRYQRLDDVGITLPVTHLALLHYKCPTSLAKKILEGQIPFVANSFAVECQQGRKKIYMGRVFHAQIDYRVSLLWKNRFKKRMQYEIT
jgi:hypothetical protein